MIKKAFKIVVIVSFCITGLLQHARISYAQPPEYFLNEVFISGLSQPSNLAFDVKSNVFVTELSGLVKIIPPGSNSPVSVFQVPDYQNNLVGVALDPNFFDNGYIYLYYVAKSTGLETLTRFRVNDNIIDPGSKFVIWQSNAEKTSNGHVGGNIAFDNAGKILLSTGDHSTGQGDLAPNNPAQKLDSPLGKILRLNPDGSIPTDNPFFDGQGPNYDAIWALGLRNPFRIFFDNKTDRLYISDVGENSFEEINIGVKGGNYGWPKCEGNCNIAGMVNPFYTYPHESGKGASITGGIVNNGSYYPQKYSNSFFYGDFMLNDIKRIKMDTRGNFIKDIPFDLEVNSPPARIVAFAQDRNGIIYYVDYSNRTVNRLSYLKHSLKFDGINDFAKANNVALPPKFTFEGWIKRNRDTNRQEVIFSHNNTDSTVLNYLLYIDGGENECGKGDKLVFYQKTGNLTLCSSLTIPVGPWVHVVITRLTGEMKMYVNGKLARKQYATPNLSTETSGQIVIGRGKDRLQNYFEGYIDEIRISRGEKYTDNFTPREILDKDPDTLILWGLNEGFGQISHDYSGNNVTMILGRNKKEADDDPQWSAKTKLILEASGNFVETE